MATFPEVVRDRVNAALCAVLGPVDSAASYLAPITGGAGTNATARALRALSCGEPGPADVPPPFIGGQCDGATYSVDAAGPTSVPGPGTMRWVGMTGPIGGLTPVVSGGAGQFRQLRLQTKNGLRPIDSGQSNIAPEDVAGWSIVGIQRTDGQPDDCGNPPPPAPAPYVPTPTTTNITYEGDDNVTYNRDIDITLLVPIINISGELEIPVDISVSPDFNLRGRIGLNPDFNISLSPGGMSDQPSALPQPEPEDEEQFIKGVVLVATCGATSRATQLFRPPGPDLCVPRIASVVFEVGVGGSTYWTVPVDVKTEVCIVPVPGALKARNFRVSPEPGSTIVSAFAFA